MYIISNRIFCFLKIVQNFQETQEVVDVEKNELYIALLMATGYSQSMALNYIEQGIIMFISFEIDVQKN